MNRRSALSALAGVAVSGCAQQPPSSPPPVLPRKGRIKQAVCGGCFGRGTPFEVMCWESTRLGIKGFDLRGPKDFEILKKYNLAPSMVPGIGSIRDGIITKENHDALEKRAHELIDAAAAAGAPNVIALSGERKGMPDPQGADNSVAFFNRIKSHAEEKGITICLELLNSKVDHPDYMCDHTSWGVDVMKRVNSPRIKLLFDIYHMAIMEGDLIRTIRANIQWIGHFHTAGNPGRNQLDENQEINYRAVAKAIAELNFQGFVAHEYSPTKGADPIRCLEQAVEIFDV